MKKKILLIPVVLLLITTLIACAAPAPAPAPVPQKPEYELRFGGVRSGAEEIAYIVPEDFCDNLARFSDGRIRTVHYPGEMLGSYEWMQEQVAMGLLDFSLVTVTTSLDTRLDVFNVPAIGVGWDDAIVRYRDPELLGVFESIAEEVGWKLLGILPWAPNLAIANVRFTPVPDEVRPLGLKMRSMMMKSDELLVEAIGFIATPMPFGEVSSAMMTGIVDGACGPGPCDLPMFEGVAKYAYGYFYRLEALALIMSLDVWNTLSKEDQEIVQKSADFSLSTGWDLAKATSEYCETRADEYGIEFIELTPEQQMINIKVVRENVWPELEKTIGKDIMDKVKKFATPL